MGSHEVFVIEWVLLSLARPETNLCGTADVIFFEVFEWKMRVLSTDEENKVER